VRVAFAAFALVALLTGVGAWLVRDDADVAATIAVEPGEVEPAANPTPLPTPTPTPEPTPDGEPEATPTPDAPPDATPAPATVVEVLGQRPELATLVELLGRSDLGETLGGPGPVTLFAPTDDAFAALAPELADALADDDALVQQLLANHVVVGLVTTDDLGADAEIEMVGGDLVPASGLVVTDGDIDGGNGVVHIVSEVVIPEPVAVQLELNALVQADPIQFAAGATDLLDESLPTLDAVAAVILDHPDLAIEVQGHTDTDGDDATNEVLSAGRSEVVRTYLISVGVPEGQLTSVGYGESDLIVDPEVTPEDKARNRRIEFRAT
jgi:outer membrane protein OmpA-like peptidoglycan-associated protein